MRNSFPVQHSRSVVILLLLVIAGCWSSPSPSVVDKSDWPRPMAKLLAKYPGIAESVIAYKHHEFVDAKFVWKIAGASDEIQRLIADLNLIPATTNHQKFDELRKSLPSDWALPDMRTISVFATKGYGEVHQEGTDLLLLVQDPVSEQTYVLYEWIF